VTQSLGARAGSCSTVKFVRRLLDAVRILPRPDTWPTLRPCDVLLVRHDGDCGYTYRGKAYAHIVDSFGDACATSGLSVRSVAVPYSRLTGARAHNHPVNYNRAAYALSLAGSVLRKLGLGPNPGAWERDELTRLWTRILAAAAPRHVIGIQPDKSVCRAGKARGVKIYDLQHGLIAGGDPWYRKESQAGTPAEDLPDGFLCWDDLSAEFLSWAPAKGIAVRVIGNPWFLRFHVPAAADPLVAEARAAGAGIFDNARPAILVSLQWGLSRFFYSQPDFNGVMCDGLERTILDTAGRCNWLLRLHPGQLRGADRDATLAYLDRTFGHLGTVDWKRCSHLPLPLALQQAAAHITDSSSVVVEAGWMGIRSALLNPLYRPDAARGEAYGPERAAGLAESVGQDAASISQWVADALARGRGRETVEWNREPLDRFVVELAA
jgi:hypothetical protein